MQYTGASVKRMNDRKGKPWRGTLQYKDESGKWRQKTRVFPSAQTRQDAQRALLEWRAQLEAESLLDATPQEPIAPTGAWRSDAVPTPTGSHSAPATQASTHYATAAGQHSATAVTADPHSPTIEDAVRAHLEHQRSLGLLSLGTFQTQLTQAQRNIFPYIGALPFSETSADALQRFVNELATRLKPGTVRSHFSIVSKTYREAVRRGKLPTNPCGSVVLPRVEQAPISYLDADGRSHFLREVSSLPETDVLRMAACLAFCTGMRASEICALRWRDVDLQTRTVHVRRSARRVKGPDGRYMVVMSAPKSAASNRLIPLLPMAVETLSELELRMCCIGIPSPDDLVLGERADPALLCANFYAWAKRRSIVSSTGKVATMHCLRHTFATIGVQSGMDVKSLSSILGHSRADMTLNVYASADEQAKRMAMFALERMLNMQDE